MTLALYRRYRPETFSEVIGQEHVTEPLQQAIRNGRVNHAYLFSGPRGCGKTTSARILARALNCEAGPTPTPCGICGSCRDLSRGGGGGLDVIEIDAASHGGVEDARDLRERAFFSPAASRFKIYVIDEAHMVTTAGFNALLKVVEEPPEHLKFVFATTEPDKVLPTIRSRTHHYPFRLVAPGVLRDHLASLCEREGVRVDPAVLPLVVRAGAGSVRDSLSVLDQLIAGADKAGLTLAGATALLGYTDATLLDEVIDAFAAGDGAAVFTLVDQVIEAGHDPRRFVVDLLDRLRDLFVLAAAGDEAGARLIDASPDQLDRMRAQTKRFGPAELSRAADLVNTGLTELRGATAPRLQLELICARVLLPGGGPVADHAGARDLHARLDRVERRLAGEPSVILAPAPPRGPAAPTGPKAPATAATNDQQPTGPSAPTGPRATAPVAPETVSPGRPGSAPGASAAEALSRTPDRSAAPQPVAAPPVAAPPVAAPPVAAPPVAAPPVAAPPVAAPPVAAPPAGRSPAGPDLDVVRRMWPDILDVVKTRRRFTWMLLVDGVGVIALHDNTLVLAFADEGKRKNFLTSGSDELLGSVIHEVLRTSWRLEAVLDPARAIASAGPAHSVGGAGVPAGRTTRPSAPPEASGPPPPSARGVVVDPAEDDSADINDEALATSGLSGPELLIRELGATVIEEIEHN